MPLTKPIQISTINILVRSRPPHKRAVNIHLQMGTLKWLTGPTKVFFACSTYNKQPTIEKKNGSISSDMITQGLYLKKKVTINSQYSRPAETDPYVCCLEDCIVPLNSVHMVLSRTYCFFSSKKRREKRRKTN